MKFNHVYFEFNSLRITPKGIVETYTQHGGERFWRIKRRDAKKWFRFYVNCVRENGGVMVRVGK